MPAVSLYCLLTVCFWSQCTALAESIDVMIVAGQSNAVGFDAPPRELPVDTIDREIMFWYRCGDPPPDEHDTVSEGWTNLKAQPLGDPIKPRKGRQYGNFAQAGGGFGPEIGLARSTAKRRRGKLAVIKVAFSGTHISGDWNPTLDQDSQNVTEQDCRGACYRSLVDETRRAIESLRQQGEPRLIALAWVQGESDATAERASAYQANISSMIAAFRKDLKSPKLIVLLAVNTRFGGGKNKHMPKVIAAQRAYADSDPLTQYVDTATASIANNAHFDAAGTIDVGQRFARQLDAMRIE